MSTPRQISSSSRQLLLIIGLWFVGFWVWSRWTAPTPAELPWAKSLEVARADAKQLGRPLLYYFTGSTWCPTCISFNREVLSTEAFARFGTNHLVFVKFDFQNPSTLTSAQLEQFDAQMQEYKVMGVPTLILMSAEGLELGRAIGPDFYEPSDLISWIQKRISTSQHY